MDSPSKHENFDGELKVYNKGSAFVINQLSSEKYFIKQNFLKGALDGDIVRISFPNSLFQSFSSARVQKILKRGKYIYSSKSSLKTSSVTWSEDEYNNYGLQAYYLKLKSFQRFVESWSLLERCDSLKPQLFIERNNLVICSIGGGPGFECIAFEKFYKMKYPNLKLSFYILDIIEPWGNYVNTIGSNYKFIKFDIFKDNLFEKVPNVDFILLFNVMHNYMLNDKGLDIINNYLTKASAILVNDRGRNIDKRNIEKKKINIINIFKDDRQMVLSKKKFNVSSRNNKTFPNNPYIN